MAFIVQREDKLAPIIHGLNMPLTLLSGIMLPMNLAPNWLKNIAYINPLYHVVEASRHLVVGNFGYAFFFMISVTGLIMWWSTRIFNKIIV
jgi:ABC-2 type transport system permease protein